MDDRVCLSTDHLSYCDITSSKRAPPSDMPVTETVHP